MGKHADGNRFEDRCDRLLAAGLGRQPAVETEDALFTFEDLDGRANRLARHLIARGDRVALVRLWLIPASARTLPKARLIWG